MTIEKKADSVKPATHGQTLDTKTTEPRVYQSLFQAFNHHMIGRSNALGYDEQFPQKFS